MVDFEKKLRELQRRQHLEEQFRQKARELTPHHVIVANEPVEIVNGAMARVKAVIEIPIYELQQRAFFAGPGREGSYKIVCAACYASTLDPSFHVLDTRDKAALGGMDELRCDTCRTPEFSR